MVFQFVQMNTISQFDGVIESRLQHLLAVYMICINLILSYYEFNQHIKRLNHTDFILKIIPGFFFLLSRFLGPHTNSAYYKMYFTF